MLKIGEFSKLSRVSVRMLRHYDEIGLLKPAETDTFTGYRYYDESQLLTVGTISSLKEMGFSLADIVKMLEICDDAERMEACFVRRRRELEAQLSMLTHQMTVLETARNTLRKEQQMNYPVSLKTVPERYAATVEMVIPRYEDEGVVWQILREETETLHILDGDPCLTAAEFPDDEYKEENVRVLVWKTVRGRYPDTEHVRFRTLPAVEAATCVVKGGYEKMPEAYAAVIGWARENGYECCGPMSNIYHVSPHETQNPAEFVTEVCYPIRKM